MPWTNVHIKWLKNTGEILTAKCGLPVQIYRFDYVVSDEVTMSAWAKHFRNHYCDDNEIEELIEDTAHSKAEYLTDIKFPIKKAVEDHEISGPATRSGDFSEILVADYLEFSLNYWVPRTRYEFKVNRNISEHGSDVLGMKFHSTVYSPQDELIIYEVKAKLTGNAPLNRLQDAVKHSDKDKFRLAESLNAARQRLRLKKRIIDSKRIGRFQNPEDKPYIMRYGAAAVVTDKVFDKQTMCLTDTTIHTNRDKLNLLIIQGPDLMSLVHKLYERAANEA